MIDIGGPRSDAGPETPEALDYSPYTTDDIVNAWRALLGENETVNHVILELDEMDPEDVLDALRLAAFRRKKAERLEKEGA